LAILRTLPAGKQHARLQIQQITALTTDTQPGGCVFASCSQLAAYYGPVGETDDVLRAMADPSRRLLLERLNQQDGQSLRELCEALSMARQSVSKHLAVLETAKLVTSERRGREKLHFLNSGPIRAIAQSWIEQYGPAPARATHSWTDWHDAFESAVAQQ
jgi:DNA-binding transcriptional ArsR family regulator